MDWTTNIITFIVGSLLGYVICRMQKNGGESKEKQQQLESELNQYKEDVEQHFAGSADLLNKMAADYSKIYQHMAQSQQKLLPDSEPAISPLFIDNNEQPPEVELAAQSVAPDFAPATTELGSESELAPEQSVESMTPAEQPSEPEQPKVTAPTEPIMANQPNDYVAGSHGIINQTSNEQTATVKT